MTLIWSGFPAPRHSEPGADLLHGRVDAVASARGEDGPVPVDLPARVDRGARFLARHAGQAREIRFLKFAGRALRGVATWAGFNSWRRRPNSEESTVSGSMPFRKPAERHSILEVAL